MNWFSLILNWVVGRIFGGKDETAIELGRAQQEIEHLKKENKDREAISKVNPASPDSAIDSLRDGKF